MPRKTLKAACISPSRRPSFVVTTGRVAPACGWACPNALACENSESARKAAAAVAITDF
jgi:hypothetical protein